MRENAELQQQIATLRAEARRSGEMLSRIGRALEQSPESLGFSDVPGNTEFVSSATVLCAAGDIDRNRVVQLVTYLRAVLDKQDRLNQEAKSLGIDLNDPQLEAGF